MAEQWVNWCDRTRNRPSHFASSIKLMQVRWEHLTVRVYVRWLAVSFAFFLSLFLSFSPSSPCASLSLGIQDTRRVCDVITYENTVKWPLAKSWQPEREGKGRKLDHKTGGERSVDADGVEVGGREKKEKPRERERKRKMQPRAREEEEGLCVTCFSGVTLSLSPLPSLLPAVYFVILAIGQRNGQSLSIFPSPSLPLFHLSSRKSWWNGSHCCRCCYSYCCIHLWNIEFEFIREKEKKKKRSVISPLQRERRNRVVIFSVHIDVLDVEDGHLRKMFATPRPHQLCARWWGRRLASHSNTLCPFNGLWRVFSNQPSL